MKLSRTQFLIPAPRQPSRRRRDEKAFTSMELIISSSLMTGILIVAYLCMHAGFSGRELIRTRSDIAQNARMALDLIAADLRSAFPLSKQYEFVGLDRMVGDVESDNMDFATHHFTPSRPREGDFCEVSYFMDRPEGAPYWSLWRRRDPTPDPEPFSGGSREEIAQGLSGLRFEYYDGFSWYNEWGNTDAGDINMAEESEPLSMGLYNDGLPDAVRVTLFFDSEGVKEKATLETEIEPLPEPESEKPPPLVFQTIVHLKLAAISRTRAYETSGASSSSGESGQTEASPQ